MKRFKQIKKEIQQDGQKAHSAFSDASSQSTQNYDLFAEIYNNLKRDEIDEDGLAIWDELYECMNEMNDINKKLCSGKMPIKNIMQVYALQNKSKRLVDKLNKLGLL